MSFDFDAAVTAPFRMQPGLRRMAPGAAHLTPLPPGSRHQREKLAVLSAFWPQALGAHPGFDAGPALAQFFAHAAQEHPQHWAWDGQRAEAQALGTAVGLDGAVVQTLPGRFGLGDEVSRCLLGLPAAWRQTGLACLTFAEDLAIVDGVNGTIPWLAVALPSHWAPEAKLGLHFTAVHGPVADNTMLMKASAGLLRLVSSSAAERWERFVWNITGHPRLHAHPARVDPQRWQHTPVPLAWWRSEHQTFIPVPERKQAVFTIHVQVQPLAEVLHTPARALALHDAVASMSPQVLAYRGLDGVRKPLLAWLAGLADGTGAPAMTPD